MLPRSQWREPLRDKVGHRLQAAAHLEPYLRGGRQQDLKRLAARTAGPADTDGRSRGGYLKDLAYQASKHLHILVSGW